MNSADHLRGFLRAHTMAQHSRLDDAMAPLAMGGDYVTFLRVQYAARQPIESWCLGHCPPGMRPPPPQTPLLARDLAALGEDAPPSPTPAVFAAPDSGFLGVAWALAGSSLGNRAMLQRRRRLQLASGAEAFLADNAMPLYWRAILPRLEAPAPPADREAALGGARAVFERFDACARIWKQKVAA